MVFRGARVTVAGAAALPMAMLTTDVSAVRVARLRKLNAPAAIGVCKDSSDAVVPDLGDFHETTCVELGDCKKTGQTTENESQSACQTRYTDDFTWTANTWEEGTCEDPTGAAVTEHAGTACEALGQCTISGDVNQGVAAANCGTCSVAGFATEALCTAQNTWDVSNNPNTWTNEEIISNKCVVARSQADCDTTGNTNLSWVTVDGNDVCLDATITDQGSCGECSEGSHTTQATCEAAKCSNPAFANNDGDACTDGDTPTWEDGTFDANTWTLADEPQGSSSSSAEVEGEGVDGGSSSSSANRAGLAFTSALTVLAMLFRS